MFKKIKQSIYELLKFKESIVKCKKCKHLINKEDAVNGGDEIRHKRTESHCGFFYTHEKYIAEIKLCPRCAAENKAASEMTATEANKVNKKNAKRK